MLMAAVKSAAVPDLLSAYLALCTTIGLGRALALSTVELSNLLCAASNMQAAANPFVASPDPAWRKPCAGLRNLRLPIMGIP